MTEYVIIAEEFANGVPCPHAGQYLKSFDHEAANGVGYGVFTKDPANALRFASKIEAMEFWRKRSTVRPTRLDGRPNRPLTALTVSVEPAP